MKLTKSEIDNVIAGIKHCNQYISLEAPRNPDTRPAIIQAKLDEAHSHKAKLMQMLTDDAIATYKEIYG